MVVVARIQFMCIHATPLIDGRFLVRVTNTFRPRCTVRGGLGLRVPVSLPRLRLPLRLGLRLLWRLRAFLRLPIVSCGAGGVPSNARMLASKSSGSLSKSRFATVCLQSNRVRSGFGG
jgi:hypothetical protein